MFEAGQIEYMAQQHIAQAIDSGRGAVERVFTWLSVHRAFCGTT